MYRGDREISEEMSDKAECPLTERSSCEALFVSTPSLFVSHYQAIKPTDFLKGVSSLFNRLPSLMIH